MLLVYHMKKYVIDTVQTVKKEIKEGKGMEKQSILYVKKRTLLAVAGCVWLLAGFNVARLGVLAYQTLSHVLAVHIVLSAIVFCSFGAMFFKMSMKHTNRIKGYQETWKPIWYFFAGKAYVMMTIMMGGGMWLRVSGLVPEVFIAVFYTGLGCALALAGVLFWMMFSKYEVHETGTSVGEMF